MRNALLAIPTLLLCVFLLGCPQESEVAPAPPPPVAELTPTESVLEAQVYDVVCGCSIKEVGRCSEWAVIDGKHVELAELNTGKSMPFCGKTGLKAEVGGQLKDGKLVVSSFKLVK